MPALLRQGVAPAEIERRLTAGPTPPRARRLFDALDRADGRADGRRLAAPARGPKSAASGSAEARAAPAPANDGNGAAACALTRERAAELVAALGRGRIAAPEEGVKAEGAGDG